MADVEPDAEEIHEAAERPASWRHVTIVETKPKRFTLMLPYTYNPIDRLMKQASGIEDPTENLPLAKAIKTGERLEVWIRAQNENARTAKKPRKQG